MAKTKIISFLKNNWKLILILIIGSFFRLYKISSYMTFLGDEGRDAIIVRNLLVYADPILIGPGTSIGGMYLGPLYYYFMAPFLFLANYSPVGPAIGIALLGVLTIYLIYIVGKDWFGKMVGLVSAALYALSPTVIIYSRSSWNPNIMPFFALLSIYAMWKANVTKKYNWLIVSAVSFAFVVQSHYLGVLILPVLLIYFAQLFFDNRKLKSKPQSKMLLKKTLLSVGIFILLMSPLALFDVRHGYLNSKAFYKFLTVRQETVSIRPWTAIPKSYPIYEQINTSLLAANNVPIGKYVSILLAVAVVWFIVKKYLTVKPLNNLAMLVLWFSVSIIGFGIYKQHIYDHYYGFLFAVPFLLFGVTFQKVFETKFKVVIILILGFIIYNLIANSPLMKTPNGQMTRAKNVSQKIREESKSARFNLGVIAERNYEDGYKYFLLKDNAPVVNIDSQIKESITDQLFVVCELPKEKCDPTHNAGASVANFGWSKIVKQWEVDGVILYRLVHSQK